jgi:hypothetical protein
VIFVLVAARNSGRNKAQKAQKNSGQAANGSYFFRRLRGAGIRSVRRAELDS